MNFLRDARARNLIIAILLSLFIWIIGPLFKPLQAADNRLLCTILLLVTWVLVNLRPQKAEDPLPVGEAWRDNNTENALTVIKQRLREALIYLRKTYPKSWQARYQLPWFLLLGPSNAGKTSLVACAKQALVASNQTPLKKITSTTHCDWWFADDAVFLDIGGKHFFTKTPAFKSRVVWQGLLKLLKRYRRRRPLDGLIITINLDDFHNQNSHQQEQLLKSICVQAQQVTELIKALPVYLVFTKCDLIAGFNEFFSDLGSEERTQPWGMQLNSTNDLESQFDELLTRINQRVIWRMHQEHELQARTRIKDFPLQIAMLKKTIFSIANELLEHTQIKLNGVYFTSSMQQGVATDYLTRHVTQAYELKAPETITHDANNKVFFSHDLFKELIHQRQESATAAEPRINYQRSLKPLTYGTGGLIIVTALTMLWHNYRSTMTTLNTVHKTLEQTNKGSDDQLLSTLQHLNHLASAIQSAKGVNQLETAAQQAYQQALLKQFAPYIKQLLTKTLQYQVDTEHLQSLYRSFSAYLALGKNKAPVVSWFQRYWQKTLEHDSTAQQQLLTHLNNLLANPNFTHNSNPQLVARVKLKLNNIPLDKLVFYMLADNYKQPAELYTATQFAYVYNDLIPETCQNLLDNHSVLDNHTQQSLGQLVQEVRSRYLNSYFSIWKNMLMNFQAVPQLSLQQLAKNLPNPNQQQSPAVVFLKKAQTNIQATLEAPQAKTLLQKNWPTLYKLTQINVNTLQASLQNLQIYINNIVTAKDPEIAAFSASALRMENNGHGDAITTMKQVAKRMPGPIKNWLNTTAQTTWSLMLTATKNHLNKHWEEEVMPQYNARIKQRFPIFNDANQEMDLTNFALFFSPDGIMSHYFQRYLKPFVNTNEFYWVWKTVDGQHLDISQSHLETFIRASLITRIFFPNGSNAPIIHFSLTPIGMEPGIESFALNVDGQNLNYRPGDTKSQTLTWPGPNAGEIQMQFIDEKGKSNSKTITGSWAWFKLLNQSVLQKTTDQRHFDLVLDLNGNSVKYHLETNNLLNPFIGGMLSNFRCPQTL